MKINHICLTKTVLIVDLSLQINKHSFHSLIEPPIVDFNVKKEKLIG